MKLLVQKLNPDAKIPSFAHANDTAMDICSVVDMTVPPRERVQVPTGLAFHFPDGYAGLIWDKSGLSQRHGLKSLGGVLDPGFRGEVMIGLYNTSAEPYQIEKGDKVAQMLVQKVEHPDIQEVSELPESERGVKGFGSTGK